MTRPSHLVHGLLIALVLEWAQPAFAQTASDPAPATVAPAVVPAAAAPALTAGASQVRLLPAGIEVPFKGGYRPPGTHVVVHSTPSVFWAGIALFAVGYLTPAIIGIAHAATGASSPAWPPIEPLGVAIGFVPLVNSILVWRGLAVADQYPDVANFYGTIDLLVQFTGIVILAVERATRFDMLHYDSEAPAVGLHATVMPLASPHGGGLALAGTF